MSMILDALRKSEAERRRGQAPDLLTEAAPAPASLHRGTRDPRNLAVIGIAAAISALLVFWWLRPGAKPADDTAIETAADTATEPAIAPGPSESAKRTAAAQQASTDALPPLQPRTLSPRPQRAPEPVAKAAVAKEAAISSSPLPAPMPPASPASQPAAQAATQQQPFSAPRVEPPPAAAPPPSAAIFASPDVPLRLTDLSSEERRQLPALKLSMHMWAPDPAGRFAIIDGTRVNEGDRVGDAVVEAIQSDGVMLSWRGRRIRLPIR